MIFIPSKDIFPNTDVYDVLLGYLYTGLKVEVNIVASSTRGVGDVEGGR